MIMIIMFIIQRKILVTKKCGTGHPLHNYIPHERAQPNGSCGQLFVLIFGSGLGITLDFLNNVTEINTVEIPKT